MAASVARKHTKRNILELFEHQQSAVKQAVPDLAG
jgi:hypothetical protein